MKLGQVKAQPSLYEIGTFGEYFTGFDRSVCTKLPAGVYEVKNHMLRGVYMHPKEMNFEKFIKLPDMQTNKIIDDINLFWKPETKTKYETMGLMYKRGILMYGKPGTGKTASIFEVAKKFVENDGVVIFNPDIAALYYMVKNIQAIEPDRKLLVIFEEFDHWLDDANFLSLLDGELQLENIVYIATTNYIDKVPPRIKNRPSRFAQVVEIGLPTLEARLTYLKAKLDDKIETQLLEQVATLTEGFVLDQVKDVIISHFVFGYTLEESLSKIKSFTWEDTDEDEEEDEKPGKVAVPTGLFR